MSKTPSEPRLSATVLLLRDQPNLQVLMVKRHYQIDFAAGALVFPGGKANEEDSDPAWAELTDGDYEGAEQAARISAIREAFEEAGIILARPKNVRGRDAPLVGKDVAKTLEPMRGPVDRREVSFLELIREHDLILALDSLVHFGHWITPTMMPKRFDTHFYLAPTPPHQVAEQDGRETTEAVWLGGQEALDMEEAGDATHEPEVMGEQQPLGIVAAKAVEQRERRCRDQRRERAEPAPRRQGSDSEEGEIGENLDADAPGRAVPGQRIEEAH